MTSKSRCTVYFLTYVATLSARRHLDSEYQSFSFRICQLSPRSPRGQKEIQRTRYNCMGRKNGWVTEKALPTLNSGHRASLTSRPRDPLRKRVQETGKGFPIVRIGHYSEHIRPPSSPPPNRNCLLLVELKEHKACLPIRPQDSHHLLCLIC